MSCFLAAFQREFVELAVKTATRTSDKPPLSRTSLLFANEKFLRPRRGFNRSSVPSFGSVSGCALRGSGRATVHDDLGAGNVGSVIRCQIQNRLCYLVGFAQAIERNSPG
jgi:hypothetical protein